MLRFKEFINEDRLLNTIVKDLKIKDNLNKFESFNLIYNHYVRKLYDVLKLVEKAQKAENVDMCKKLKENIDLLLKSILAYKTVLRREKSILIFNDLIHEYKKNSIAIDEIIKNLSKTE